MPAVRPFQQKRDAGADEKDWPDPEGVSAWDHTHAGEQEHDAANQKQWASNDAVKRVILKPVGNATDGHGKKARSR
ncbi:MAG: hypothetical protein WCC04_16935 [Terriglobales bacterium]